MDSFISSPKINYVGSRRAGLGAGLAVLALMTWADVSHAACPTSAGGTPSFNATPINVAISAEATGGDGIQAIVVMQNTADDAQWCQGGDFPVSLDLDAASIAAGWQLASPVQATTDMIDNNATGLFVAELTAPSAAGNADVSFELSYEDLLGNPVTFGTATTAETVDVVCAAASPFSGNDATIALETPAEVELGSSFMVRATVTNTGTNCWRDNGAPYVIGREHPSDPDEGIWPSPHRQFVDTDLMPIKPGDDFTIEYQVGSPIALPTKVTHDFKAQMIRQGGGGWFGQQASNSLKLVSVGILDATFLNDEIDVPSVVVPGERYTMRVSVQNTGSKTWLATGPTGIVLRHHLDSLDWQPSREVLPHDVFPNGRITFELDILARDVADPTATTYDSLRWEMLDTVGNPPVGTGPFGEKSAAFDPEISDMRYRVTTSGDLFILDDPFAPSPREFVMRGFNYVPFYDFEGPTPPAGVIAQNNAWRSYKEEVTEREFREMARLGANTVRFWAPDEYQDSLVSPPPLSKTETCTRLNHALDSAYRNGLRVVLSLPINRNSIIKDHCQGVSNPLCTRNPGSIAKVSTLFFEESFRDTVIDSNIDLLKDCNVLQNADLTSRPPRIFSLEFWQEPSGGDNKDRKNFSPSREWEEYVINEHSTLANAFNNVWNYTPSVTCGNPLGVAGLETYLCPPDGEELCSGDATDDWATMTKEYREFVDDRAHDTYQEAITKLDAYMNTDLGLPASEQPMVTLGFASVFARENLTHRKVCGGDEAAPEAIDPNRPDFGRGYFLDPRLGKDLFDYASIHLYPWSDQFQLFDEQSPTTKNRYNQMRFLLDYIRTDRPVVMEETGYNTCNDPSTEILLPNGVESPDALGCTTSSDARDLVQKEVWGKEVESLAQVQANGGLFWAFRNRVDRGQWGARRLDDTEKPVYADIPQLLLDIEDGRDLPTQFEGCVTVDPYAVPNWNTSLMASFAAYLLQADDGTGGYDPVKVRVETSCFTTNP